MKLSYDEMFKYSDILNPISPNALFLAGKLAELGPKKVILDLGSGKGFPSLLWAGLFGVQVEGYDMIKSYVEYANSRAKILNISHLVKFYCKDIKKLKLTSKYDVVAFLGLGLTHIFGNINNAFKNIKNLLNEGGFLIFAEPSWSVKDIPLEVLENLNVKKEDFFSKQELAQLIKKCGFQVQGSFDSTKEDWKLYIQPVINAMNQVIENEKALAEEAQLIIKSFKSEYDAVNKYWNMVLWIAKAI